MKQIAILLVGLCSVLTFAGIQQAAPRTEPLAELDWLAGDWQGAMGPMHAQEIWTEPKGNNMTGMFRMLKPDGSVQVLELLVISHEEGMYVLKFRHFDGALTPWADEADGPIVLYADRVDGKSVHFKNADIDAAVRELSMRREGDTFTSSILTNGADEPFGFQLKLTK